MVYTCQHCQQESFIDTVDLEFYRSVNVPPPTFCWRCRMQRRFAFRNERKLYAGNCAKTGKPIITIFNPANSYIVYDRDVWWNDDWSALEFGQPYDFDQPFFNQWERLFKHVPHPAVFNSQCTNSNYCNHVGELNNCYLAFASWENDQVCYATRVAKCKDSFDLSGSNSAELCYQTVGGNTLYNVQFAQNTSQARDSQFLDGCKNVFDCFGCVNLRNKSYCFFNEQLDATAYRARVADLDLGSYQNLLKAQQRFQALQLASVHRFSNSIDTTQSTGNNLLHTENCQYCFDARHINDCRYCVNAVGPLSDSYDGYGVGAEAQFMYETVDAGIRGSWLLFDVVVWGGNNVQYSYNCTNCKDCFGCIGLRNAQYCILNQQYSKEEYERLLPRIIAQMKTHPYIDTQGCTYAYGEFFPTAISPFAYNETVAQEHFPLTEAAITQRGWRYQAESKDAKQFTVKASELPDHIQNTPETITNAMIQCLHAGACVEQCTEVYKILPAEYQYLKQRNIALPRLCPNCRHFERLAQERPLNLWSRQCGCQRTAHGHKTHCANFFMTSVPESDPAAIYCEDCYLAEVN